MTDILKSINWDEKYTIVEEVAPKAPTVSSDALVGYAIGSSKNITFKIAPTHTSPKIIVLKRYVREKVKSLKVIQPEMATDALVASLKQRLDANELKPDKLTPIGEFISMRRIKSEVLSRPGGMSLAQLEENSLMVDDLRFNNKVLNEGLNTRLNQVKELTLRANFAEAEFEKMKKSHAWAMAGLTSVNESIKVKESEILRLRATNQTLINNFKELKVKLRSVSKEMQILKQENVKLVSQLQASLLLSSGASLRPIAEYRSLSELSEKATWSEYSPGKERSLQRAKERISKSQRLK